MRLLDADLHLTTNSDPLHAHFRRLYSALEIPESALRSDARRSQFIVGRDCTLLQLPDRRWELPAPYPDFAHNLIWYDGVQSVRSHLVLHAAAVAHAGQAALIVGRSMSGKTTLTLALHKDGARLLTDDAVGLNYATGELQAVARQVQIRPKTRTLLDLPHDPVVRPADPQPLAALFLLDNHAQPPNHTLMLDVQHAPPAWREQLTRLPAVQTVRFKAAGTGWVRAWVELTVSADRAYAPIEQLCAQHDVLIYNVQTEPDRPPQFAEVPIVWPLAASDAAFHLLPHLQNRTVAQQHGGEIPLYLKIAALLKNTRCYRLTVGSPQKTSAAVLATLNPHHP